jgi:hypothetical protein
MLQEELKSVNAAANRGIFIGENLGRPHDVTGKCAAFLRKTQDKAGLVRTRNFARFGGVPCTLLAQPVNSLSCIGVKETL